MDSGKDKKIVINKIALPALLLLVLLISLIGGVFGSIIYKDYLSQRISGDELSIFNTKISLEEDSAVIEAAKKVNPAVVSITGVTQRLDFFGRTTEAESSGTGFIVRSDGLIVTNKHVVIDPSTKYTVYTNSGEFFDVKVESLDPVFDIAILKISAENLPVVELGNSDNLLPGQRVIAIGNALGQYQNSVTTGVVSAIGRVIQASDSTGATESLDNVIQTDAAINPGNSGGPLLNITGQVIGVNTAVDKSGQSIGFALPISLVKSALNSYVTKGRIIRPMLGVRYISLNKDIATSNDLPVNEGALIYSANGGALVVGGPAEKAGLKINDIIVKINDDKITQVMTLVSLVNKYSVGDNINLMYLRDGKEITTTVTLSETK